MGNCSSSSLLYNSKYAYIVTLLFEKKNTFRKPIEFSPIIHVFVHSKQRGNPIYPSLFLGDYERRKMMTGLQVQYKKDTCKYQ